MELFVFLVAGGACIVGALGVVLNSNPVHAALSLVGTLFGIAVLFVAQEAHFLAAVQVIVYAGAIVVLFLFVLMLLGVDRAEDLSIEPLGGAQRIAAVLIGLAVLALPLFAFWSTDGDATGRRAAGRRRQPDRRRRARHRPARRVPLHHLPLRLRGHQRAPGDRRRRRRGAGPEGQAGRADRGPAGLAHEAELAAAEAEPTSRPTSPSRRRAEPAEADA